MKKIFKLLLLLLGQILLYPVIGKSTFFIQEMYLPLYSLYSRVIGGIMHYIPFSVGDILYFLGALFLIRQLFFLVKYTIQRNREKMSSQWIRGLYIANIAIAVYYLCWGWVYYISDFYELYSTEYINTEVLKQLSIQWLEDCQTIRSDLEEDTQGIVQNGNLAKEWALHLDKEYRVLPKEIQRFSEVRPSNLKVSLFSPLMKYWGVSGYFNPFTRECHIISPQSAVRKPRTIAHEMAHSWAYGKESEANFIAYVLGDKSDNKMLKYSTQFSALRSALNRIEKKDSIFVHAIRSQWSEGMKRDMRADSILQSQLSSNWERQFARLNSTFLKMNQQEGLSSYGNYMKWVVGYEKEKRNKEK